MRPTFDCLFRRRVSALHLRQRCCWCRMRLSALATSWPSRMHRLLVRPTFYVMLRTGRHKQVVAVSVLRRVWGRVLQSVFSPYCASCPTPLTLAGRRVLEVLQDRARSKSILMMLPCIVKCRCPLRSVARPSLSCRL